MTINKELLAKVRDHILEEPRRYKQSTFGRESKVAPCGTQACIAGWAFVLNGGSVKVLYDSWGHEVAYAAREALGLTDREADTLFSDGGWPVEWQEKYINTEGYEARAKVAADYLNHIIETGEVGESCMADDDF